MPKPAFGSSEGVTVNTTQRSAKNVSIFIVAAVLLLGATAVVAAYKSRRPMVETFNQGVSVFDDFLTANANTTAGEYTGLYYRSIVANGGTATNGSSTAYPGYVRLTATDPNDGVCLRFTSSLFLENSALLISETRFQTDAPGTSVGNNSEMYFGFVTVTGGDLSTLSNGVVFTYDRGVSDNFRIWHAAGGVVTQQTLDYPVEADTDYYLKVVLSGSSAVFLINNVQVGSLSLGIGASTPLSPVWYLEKNLGSTGVHHLDTDAVGVYQQFIDPRIFSNTNVTQ